VAGRAALGFARGASRAHPLGEFALVNVFMATGATEIVEVVDRNLGASGCFVAVDAGYRLVSASEREARPLMLLQCVVRTLEGGSVMALLAAVEPGGTRELARVLVLMAIDAERKVDLVTGRLTGWGMAIGALYLGVRGDQRKAGFGMIRDCIRGGNPAVHRVATLASPSVGALQELASVRIWLVAVGAICEGDGRFEIRALVAAQAGDLLVFAQERKARLGVIEGRGKGGLLPRRGGVAGFAALLELALVGIGVASRAGGEGETRIFRLAIGPWGMASLAGNVEVRPGQRIAGLRVVEVLGIDSGGLPVCG